MYCNFFVLIKYIFKLMCVYIPLQRLYDAKRDNAIDKKL